MEGIEIFNDKGSISISSNYNNMVFKGKARKTDRKAFKSSGAFYAIKPDISKNSNSNYCTPFGMADSSYGDMDVYMFDVPAASDTANLPNYGLEVLRKDGSIAYNSNLKYLKVIDSSNNYKGKGKKIFDTMPGLYSYEGYERTLNYGHPNVAVMFLSAFRVAEVDSVGFYSLLSCCKMDADNNLVISDFQMFDVIDEFMDRRGISTACQWLVIDITGL